MLPVRTGLGRPCVLFDVDGTLIDASGNQRTVWARWAERYRLDADYVYQVALRTRPAETFGIVAPGHDPAECLALLHELEDEDVRSGRYDAFEGASEVLRALPTDRWALVTSNYEHRVRARFERTGLPSPELVVDAAATSEGKPSPVPYLFAAELLRAAPEDCLVVEDAASGISAGLAAGMTVWSVNSTTPPAPSHRHFASLAQAVPDTLSFMAR
jgi:mannitol-1-/sugar-/sorbitol-6-phosphatase